MIAEAIHKPAFAPARQNLGPAVASVRRGIVAPL